MLAARADPEGAKQDARYSPLMSAARWGHDDVVALLLKAGAVPRRRNCFGEDALMLARAQGHRAVLKLLHSHVEQGGAPTSDIDLQANSFGCTEWMASRQARHSLGHGWTALGTEFYV